MEMDNWDEEELRCVAGVMLEDMCDTGPVTSDMRPVVCAEILNMLSTKTDDPHVIEDSECADIASVDDTLHDHEWSCECWTYGHRSDQGMTDRVRQFLRKNCANPQSRNI